MDLVWQAFFGLKDLFQALRLGLVRLHFFLDGF
jgi:hypothetical protein